MERLAAAYGWTEATIGELELDRFEAWAELAAARLKTRAQAACPWGARG